MSSSLEWPEWLQCYICSELTDIHLMGGDVIDCRIRCQGTCQVLAVDKDSIERFIHILFWACGFTSHKHESYLHAQITISGDEVRVSYVPVVTGKRLCLRILHPLIEYELPVGLMPDLWAGCILIVGQTGAGKTTEAYRILSRVAPYYVVLTIEDPPEQSQQYCAQIELNDAVSSRDLLKAVLRHDPDVIFIGEIRDRASVDLFRNWMLTGHAVITTMHAKNIDEAWDRLVYLGFPAISRHYIERIVVMKGHQSSSYYWDQKWCLDCS